MNFSFIIMQFKNCLRIAADRRSKWCAEFPLDVVRLQRSQQKHLKAKKVNKKAKFDKNYLKSDFK